MSIPYINEARETFTQRMEQSHLWVALAHHKLGNARSMWLQLFYFAMVEDIYGAHWDKLNEKKYAGQYSNSQQSP
jgi:hypothetical protein